jgi:CRP-like cAMP-binding protein
MENELIKHISKFITLNDEEAKVLAEHNPVRRFKKGAELLRKGEIAEKCWFVLKGYVRQYRIIDGSEKTTFFYTEHQAIAPTSSYENQIPSEYYLSCIEDTVASVTNLRTIPKMFKKYPKFESLSLIFMEQDYGQTKDSFANFKTSSPEDRYLHLLETRPDLLRRVPQHYIASYIGVTPESLSRIRKRISERCTNN